MFRAKASNRIFGKRSVHRCPAHAEGVGNRARGFTAGLRSSGQSSLLLIKRLRPADVLPTCPASLTRRYTAFPAKFQFKFSQTGEHTGHHPTCGIARVDALA